MNLALSDEQVFLREAARGALSRFKTLEAAREALDGDESALPDLWPTAMRGRLAGPVDRRGARRRRASDAFDAMLVLGECGRVLAGDPAARPPARDRDPQRLAQRRRVPGRPGQRRATRRLPARAARRATSTRSWSADPAQRARARARCRSAGAPGDGRPRAAQRQLCVRARRARAPTRSSASRCSTASPSASPIARRRRRRRDRRRCTRYDATRSLGARHAEGRARGRARRARRSRSRRPGTSPRR